jgi:sulfatase-modifying factor enzyme 1/PAN domain-containing protein
MDIQIKKIFSFTVIISLSLHVYAESESVETYVFEKANYWGNDYKKLENHTDIQECARLCDSDISCVVASYHDETAIDGWAYTCVLRDKVGEKHTEQIGISSWVKKDKPGDDDKRWMWNKIDSLIRHGDTVHFKLKEGHGFSVYNQSSNEFTLKEGSKFYIYDHHGTSDFKVSKILESEVTIEKKSDFTFFGKKRKSQSTYNLPYTGPSLPDSLPVPVQPEQIEWNPIESVSDCTISLAGYGKRKKAICFSMIHNNARGPLMVVIPKEEDSEKHYAISKYEISINDWAKYCILSNNCDLSNYRDNKKYPISNIDIEQAEQYISWLSNRTGKKYRLPSYSEWRYAADSNGMQPEAEFNCNSDGLINYKHGKPNAWGIKNYIGNVKEWVTSETGDLMTVGGDFSTSLDDCNIDFQQKHDGSADLYTGFRVLMEIK